MPTLSDTPGVHIFPRTAAAEDAWERLTSLKLLLTIPPVNAIVVMVIFH
jgi:hypothetical protein